MGMFDSFYARCPQCGTEVEFQTKAGDCLLRDYRPNDAVPLAIVASLDGDVERCHNCEAEVRLRASYQPTLVVS